MSRQPRRLTDEDLRQNAEPVTPMPDVEGAQLLVRALKLIFYIRDVQKPVSTADLAEALGIPLSNTYRLLQTLELSGLVERRARGEIVLGLHFLDLGRIVQKRLDDEIAPIALPIMRQLTAETDETSLMTMRTGLQVICVLAVDSPLPVRLSFAPGRVLPLYRGASGRVLLPWLPTRVLAQVLAEAADTGVTSGESSNAVSLRDSLDHIRSDGYLVTTGEVDPYTTAIAAPILVDGGRLLGGLTLAGPSGRFPAERVDNLVGRMRSAANAIGQHFVASAGPRPST
jgi:DNA-binding IclR family transcriptional regulator